MESYYRASKPLMESHHQLASDLAYPLVWLVFVVGLIVLDWRGLTLLKKK